MLISNGEREALVLILHEIYGINEHMKSAANELAALGFAVMVPNLLGKDLPFSYEEEKMAYAYFTGEIGFEAAFRQVKNLLIELQPIYKEIQIVGYSAGATLAWLCSELPGVTAVTGFYGSRIRYYPEIKPACPVLLLYGEEESFDVQALRDRLSRTSAQIISLPGKHGFADPYAPAYHPRSAMEAEKKMKNFCIRHSSILF